MGGKKLSKDEFVRKADIVHLNKYDYTESIYVSSDIKMVIICNEHGKFNQTPHDHLKGHGCRKCYNELCSRTKIGQARDSFVDKASAIHGNKYSYEMVEYKSTHSKVQIHCPYHGYFHQSPACHLQGQGCPSCAKSGFKRNKPAFLYILITDGGFVGFGISGNLKTRLSAHKRNLIACNIEILGIYIFSGSGEDILAAEKYIKTKYVNSGVFIEGFKTEAFTNDRLSEVLNYLRDNKNLR